MSSFEEVPDDKLFPRTLIRPEVTGGEEDPGFKPTALDNVLAVNHPYQEERAVEMKEAPSEAAPHAGEVEYKEAA